MATFYLTGIVKKITETMNPKIPIRISLESSYKLNPKSPSSKEIVREHQVNTWNTTVAKIFKENLERPVSIQAGRFQYYSPKNREGNYTGDQFMNLIVDNHWNVKPTDTLKAFKQAFYVKIAGTLKERKDTRKRGLKMLMIKETIPGKTKADGTPLIVEHLVTCFGERWPDLKKYKIGDSIKILGTLSDEKYQKDGKEVHDVKINVKKILDEKENEKRPPIGA
jgi:hypothetical protein